SPVHDRTGAVTTPALYAGPRTCRPACDREFVARGRAHGDAADRRLVRWSRRSHDGDGRWVWDNGRPRATRYRDRGQPPARFRDVHAPTRRSDVQRGGSHRDEGRKRQGRRYDRLRPEDNVTRVWPAADP